jgi:hypothetical protein
VELPDVFFFFRDPEAEDDDVSNTAGKATAKGQTNAGVVREWIIEFSVSRLCGSSAIRQVLHGRPLPYCVLIGYFLGNPWFLFLQRGKPVSD